MSKLIHFASRQQRYQAATAFSKTNNPSIGGRTDDPLYSYEIDAVLLRASDLTTFPAEFAPMIRALDPRAREMFLAAAGKPFVFPFHCERHWLAVRVSPGLIQMARFPWTHPNGGQRPTPSPPRMR